MGIYADYINRNFDWPELEDERKHQLKRVSDIRKRPVLVYASDLNNKKADISINFDDRLPFQDQLSNIDGDEVDVILETPGGYAEVVEDLVNMLRAKFSRVEMIIPGYAKSAGTIMAMSGDEILMEPSSALEPIDAQMMQNSKRFSAHAFLEGLEKIKSEVIEKNNLNRAYIPILQNISPADIQECENAQDFSRILVTRWLSQYKFKYWDTHSSTGLEVTLQDKARRAGQIARTLCNHGKWLTHGRSVTLNDLREMKLQITDYSEQEELCDAIRKYYTLMRLTFDTTSIYKIFETPSSQIYKHMITEQQIQPVKAKKAIIDFSCNKCGKVSKLQATFEKGVPLEEGVVLFPSDNIYICPGCGTRHDLSPLRMQIESQTKKQILKELGHEEANV